MKLTLAGTLLVFTVLLSACCFPLSQNPLSDPKNAAYDDRLEGTWRILFDKDEVAFLHIGKTKDNLTKLITVSFNKTGVLDSSEYIMFPTLTDKTQYMNVIIDSKTSKDTDPEKKYMFAKYWFEKNGYVAFSVANTKVLTDAVKTGKLKGLLKNCPTEADKNNGNQKTSSCCATITDNSENILKFIKEADQNILFPLGKDALKARKIQ